LIPIKTPSIVKRLFPNYVWDIKTRDKSIFLTFDDGPTPEITCWVLNQLKAFNAKATFFCIGDNIEKYPHIYQSIIEQEHTVGNHTYNHLKGWATKTPKYISNIELTEKLICSKLFRPPYGKLKRKQGKILIEKGYKIIMWDVLSLDWDKSINGEQCYQNVIKNAAPGSIIVFHDSVKASKNLYETLPRVLKFFSQKGYSFKALNYI